MTKTTTIFTATTLVLLITLYVHPTHALTKLLEPGCGSSLVLEKCVNIGSPDTVGRYIGDTDLVKYKKNPSIIPYTGEVINADEAGAYATLVRKKSVRFFIEVPERQDYDVTVGLIDYENCENGNKIKLSIGGKKMNVNPYEEVGCNTAVQYTIQGARSSKKGRISFKIKGKKPVTVATICVKRRLMSKSQCSTPGCLTFDGCGNYAVINASSAIPGPPCASNPSSFTSLSLPDGVTITNALLQWSGSGFPKDTTTDVTLNGKSVTSSQLYKNGEFEPYYGASADVTEIVQEFGGNTDYVVEGIFTRPYHSCPQAHISAWSLTVVYEKADLPLARVNVCTNSKSTSQQLDYTIGCMVPNVPDVSARTTLVAIEGEQFTERLAINDKFIGFNLFKGNSGEGFDVLTLDLAEFLTGSTETITYSFTDNSAHDSLILAVMNTYQTLSV